MPLHPDIGILVWCAVSLAAAGTVKGVMGIGIPVVSLSLMTFAISAPAAVALLPVPLLVANLWQARGVRPFVRAIARFWTMSIGLTAGLIAGGSLLGGLDPELLLGVVGLAVCIFSASELWAVRLRVAARHERMAGLFAGGIGGLLGGMTTLFGPPLIMLLVARGLEKEEFVQVISSVYLLGAFVIFLVFTGFGVIGWTELGWSALATVPLFAGVLLGQWLRGRTSEATFRKVLLVVLLIVGGNLVRRAAIGV